LFYNDTMKKYMVEYNISTAYSVSHETQREVIHAENVDDAKWEIYKDHMDGWEIVEIESVTEMM
jgi:hypothetical protein